MIVILYLYSIVSFVMNVYRVLIDIHFTASPSIHNKMIQFLSGWILGVPSTVATQKHESESGL